MPPITVIPAVVFNKINANTSWITNKIHTADIFSVRATKMQVPKENYPYNPNKNMHNSTPLNLLN